MVPGNTSSLWKAVKTAKDVNQSELPNTMYINNTAIARNCLPETLAKFFSEKLVDLGETVQIDEQNCNGKKKVQTENKMFMDKESIRKCILSLKVENSKGFDGIPQRILFDGVDQLIAPLGGLFKLIYDKKTVPGQ